MAELLLGEAGPLQELGLARVCAHGYDYVRLLLALHLIHIRTFCVVRYAL